jgi:hypothetical protein
MDAIQSKAEWKDLPMLEIDGAAATAGIECPTGAGSWNGKPVDNNGEVTDLNELTMQGLFAVDDSIPADGGNAASDALFEGWELKGNRFIKAANWRHSCLFSSLSWLIAAFCSCIFSCISWMLVCDPA